MPLWSRNKPKSFTVLVEKAVSDSTSIRRNTQQLLVLGGEKPCLLSYSSKNKNAKSGVDFVPAHRFRYSWRNRSRQLSILWILRNRLRNRCLCWSLAGKPLPFMLGLNACPLVCFSIGTCVGYFVLLFNIIIRNQYVEDNWFVSFFSSPCGIFRLENWGLTMKENKIWISTVMYYGDRNRNV